MFETTKPFPGGGGPRPPATSGRAETAADVLRRVEADGQSSVGSFVQPVPPAAALSTATEAQLAGALRDGDLSALDEVFRRHACTVAMTVRGIAGGHYVDDVVQDVFLALWQSPERFDPARGSLARYLAMITRSRTIDVLRSEGAWQRRQSRQGSTPITDLSAEDLALEHVDIAELRSALRALPMSERVAIELAFFGGCSYRQVAAQLEEPEGTIKSRIRSGLRRLEAALRWAAADA